jgi:hypothetical protein
MKINLKMMIEEPRTLDEVEVKESDPLFGLKLVIDRKDDKLLDYLYTEKASLL